MKKIIKADHHNRSAFIDYIILNARMPISHHPERSICNLNQIAVLLLHHGSVPYGFIFSIVFLLYIFHHGSIYPL